MSDLQVAHRRIQNEGDCKFGIYKSVNVYTLFGKYDCGEEDSMSR